MSTFAIDPRSRLPLHAQAEQLLRQLIQEPAYREGELLPDELTLAAQLGVSRGTVRAAIARLVNERLLERRAGVGTRVVARSAESSIAAWRSLTREMAEQGIEIETYEVKCRRVATSQAAARALLTDAGIPILRLDRLRGWDGQRVLHSRSWFHPRLSLTGAEDFRSPLYELIERQSGVVADSAREELRAVAADARMARLLQVPRQSPLLLRRHVVRDRRRRPFEFAEVHYVSHRYSLTIDLQRGDR